MSLSKTTGLCALALSYALAGNAAAQEEGQQMLQLQIPPTTQLPERAITLEALFPKVEFEERTAEQRGARDVVRVAVEPGAFGPVSALSSFNLDFWYSDHKIRHIAVMRDDRFARFAFSDQNGDDQFDSSALWHDASQGIAGEISGAGIGRMQVDIDPGPEGYTLVMTGFEFRRKDETDANVRTLGVSLDGEENTISVTLLDDMGPDFRNFETTLGVAALMTLTPFAAAGHIGTMYDAVARLNGGTLEAGGSYGRPYAFSVQYAWIPNWAVEDHEGARSGNQYREVEYIDNQPVSGYRPPAGRVALQSFFFTFMNSDHHLQRVKIDLKDRDGEWTGTRFGDSDRGDPMQWTVEYVTLKD